MAVLAGTTRFASAVYQGRHELVYGDYAATLPGGYAERLNPTLWNSPDLAHSWAFHQHSYLHGPTQFLTLYPLVFLDSYAAIARLLLYVYPVVVLTGVWVVCRMLDAVEGERVTRAGVYAATLAFFPIIQAYSQREFEIVLFLAVAVMFWAAVRDRQRWLGSVVAFITWFKYLPIVLVPYLAARRRVQALAWFAFSSAILLLAAQLLFGLPHFVNDPVTSTAGGQLSVVDGRADFCVGAPPVFRPENHTFAGVRWALCTLQDAGALAHPLAAYLAIVLTVAVVAIVGFVRIERRRDALSAADQRWRSVLELGLLVTVYTTFFFTHYYYLAVLAVPLSALLVRFVRGQRWYSLALWASTYASLSTFTVPVGLVDRLIHVHPWEFDAWKWYMRHVVYLPGELGLVALLLHEYVRLGARTAPRTLPC